jgi:hypothetical protein
MPQDMQPETESIGHDTPLRAARRHCLQCCGASSHESQALFGQVLRAVALPVRETPIRGGQGCHRRSADLSDRA